MCADKWDGVHEVTLSTKLLLKAANAQIYIIKVSNFFRFVVWFKYFKFRFYHNVLTSEVVVVKTQYLSKIPSVQRHWAYQPIPTFKKYTQNKSFLYCLQWEQTCCFQYICV